jgi:predicted nucleic-acid-binding protein
MERTAEQLIIADTSGLVFWPQTLTRTTTQLPKQSRSFARQHGLFSSLISLLRRCNVFEEKRHETARKAASELLNPESQFLLIETGPYLFTALEKFKAQPPAVSLTDCIVMAVADDYGTKDIFGFDRQFANAGYTRLAPATEWKTAR